MDGALADIRRRAEEASNLVAGMAERCLNPALQTPWALLAVGGFGRRELFPYSDLDLLLLVEDPREAVRAKDAIGSLWRELWDRGWKPSHLVRTPAECCAFQAHHAEFTLSLLTRRFLAGSTWLFERLTEKWPEFLRNHRRAVIAHLLALTTQRWARYQQTIYHLEPDVKEAPGALRDLHWIEWIHILESGRHGPGRTQATLDRLRPAREFLIEVRWRLHRRAGRNDNRLLFAAQDELFEQPESGMRQYFRHARAIYREAQQLLEEVRPPNGPAPAFLDWRSRLSDQEFAVVRERVQLRDPNALAVDPAVLLRLIQFVAQHGFQAASDTERRLEALAQDPGWQFPGPVWTYLRAVLQQPHAARALRLMQQTGLLMKILPEWSRVECLVTRDFYHRYTVDEHTLVTLESLEQLAASKDDAWAPMRDLLVEAGDLSLLRLALLLHDLGKAGGRGESESHEERSGRLAAAILERWAVPEADRQTVLFLIEHHLDLPGLMLGRDLTDAATLAAAAHRIGTLERLRWLTLLTFADISGVHPGALTPWRLSQLLSAYRSLYREFARELEDERIEDEPSLPGDDFERGFPTRYRLVHSAAERQQHRLMAAEAQTSGVALRLERLAECWELTVVTRDRRRLFADIAGALASFGLNILKAEAFGNRASIVVDIWRFHDPLRRLELNPEDLFELQQLVRRAVNGEETIDRLLAGRFRGPQAKARAALEPVAAFDNSASARATLLEVVAPDRPGLLYELAAAIHRAGCDIEVVLVNTEGHRAIDVFYLTYQEQKLPKFVEDQLRQSLLEILRPA